MERPALLVIAPCAVCGRAVNREGFGDASGSSGLLCPECAERRSEVAEVPPDRRLGSGGAPRAAAED